MSPKIFSKINRDLGPIGSHAYYAHHYFTFPKLTGEIGPNMRFGEKRMLNWSLNNYLGLANHPEVRQADVDAAAKYGLAYPMGSRMMTGNSDLHEIFESQLAEFVGKEEAFLMNFGYQGIMSVIECLADRRDVIVYDSENHACLIDGVRLHKAKGGRYFKYVHNDMESLEKNLQRAQKLADEQGGGIMVVTEGVFGMTGQIGRIDEIVELKKKYDFALVVDDAHGFGVMGKNGGGIGEYFDCSNQIDIYFSTFTKSMAAMGAFVAASSDVIMYLKYNVRSQIFAKALPMTYVAGGLKRLELIKKHPELRQQMWKIAYALQSGLRKKGFDLGTTNSHVTPVFLHHDYELNIVTSLVRDLRENMGIFCSIIIYPVVPKGVIMLRLIPTATHSLEDVEYTISCFEVIQQRLVTNEYAMETDLLEV